MGFFLIFVFVCGFFCCFFCLFFLLFFLGGGLEFFGKCLCGGGGGEWRCFFVLIWVFCCRFICLTFVFEFLLFIFVCLCCFGVFKNTLNTFRYTTVQERFCNYFNLFYTGITCKMMCLVMLFLKYILSSCGSVTKLSGVRHAPVTPANNEVLIYFEKRRFTT